MPKDTKDLKQAMDYLSEQKRKLDISLFYTHNDIEKSKNMVSGIYKDLYAIKVKFSASTAFGAFLMFFNIPYSTITHLSVHVSHSYLVWDLKTSLPWREYEENLEKLKKTDIVDDELTFRMRDELNKAFTVKLGQDQRAIELKKHLEANDEIVANRVIKKFIQDRFGYKNIDLSVDYESVSSLDMELFSITSKKIDIKEQPHDEETESQAEDGQDGTNNEDNDFGAKNYQLLLNGELVLSPIKGKNISSLRLSDRIKVTLDISNPKAISVAKAFKAYDDQKIQPITGRIVFLKHLNEGGYKIFCIIAKGIYVKIVEEEEDIKIALEEDEKSAENPKSSLSKTSLKYIIILLSVIIVLISIIAGYVLS
jgi:hypothetical protein